MHDIDRTQLEYSHEANPFQQEEFEFQEFESGMMSEEMSEHEEIQLAHELLAVTNEHELEQFLGSFIKRRQHRRSGRQVAGRPGDRRRAQGRRQARRCRWPAPRLAATSAARSAPRSAPALPTRPARRSGSSRKLARTRSSNSRAHGSSSASPPTPPARPQPPRLPEPTRAPPRKPPPSPPRGGSRPGCSSAGPGAAAGGASAGMLGARWRRRPLAAPRPPHRALRGVRRMPIGPLAARMLEQEARALLTRLDRVKTVRAHSSRWCRRRACSRTHNRRSSATWSKDEGNCDAGRRFLGWLARARASSTAADRPAAYSRSCACRFNAVLNEFDMFSDVITQRSEHENGAWLSGLDVVAADALTLPGGYYELPPIVCYLDRGAGRCHPARTHAPARRPQQSRQRSSACRESAWSAAASRPRSSMKCGHQAAALLDLVASLRPVLQGLQRGARSRSRPVGGLGALDLRDRRRLLVGGARRRRCDAGADGRRQSAARLRVPHRSITTRIRRPGCASS